MSSRQRGGSGGGGEGRWGGGRGGGGENAAPAEGAREKGGGETEAQQQILKSTRYSDFCGVLVLRALTF